MIVRGGWRATLPAFANTSVLVANVMAVRAAAAAARLLVVQVPRVLVVAGHRVHCQTERQAQRHADQPHEAELATGDGRRQRRSAVRSVRCGAGGGGGGGGAGG